MKTFAAPFFSSSFISIVSTSFPPTAAWISSPKKKCVAQIHSFGSVRGRFNEILLPFRVSRYFITRIILLFFFAVKFCVRNRQPRPCPVWRWAGARAEFSAPANRPPSCRCRSSKRKKRPSRPKTRPTSSPSADSIPCAGRRARTTHCARRRHPLIARVSVTWLNFGGNLIRFHGKKLLKKMGKIQRKFSKNFRKSAEIVEIFGIFFRIFINFLKLF